MVSNLLMDYEQKHGFEWDTPREAWDGLKAQVDASGVVISSLTSCQNFHSENAAARDETVRRVTRVIDMAEFMGCDHVRVLGDRYTEENRDAVVGYVTDGTESPWGPMLVRRTLQFPSKCTALSPTRIRRWRLLKA